ncbi:hypothetical protein STPH2_3542 [Streptomyces sp. KO7888]|nr:hypothetical protein [Streptomyces sp. KO7888]
MVHLRHGARSGAQAQQVVEEVRVLGDDQRSALPPSGGGRWVVRDGSGHGSLPPSARLPRSRRCSRCLVVLVVSGRSSRFGRSGPVCSVGPVGPVCSVGSVVSGRPGRVRSSAGARTGHREALRPRDSRPCEEPESGPARAADITRPANRSGRRTRRGPNAWQSRCSDPGNRVDLGQKLWTTRWL